jgi:pilus assembly protein CpaE
MAEIVVNGAASPGEAARIIAFVSDATTEQVLRETLRDAATDGLEVRRGNVRSAVAAMMKLKTPEILIVDLSGEDQPLSMLTKLSEVVEPNVILLVIGDTDNIGFYRRVTHELGAMEYIFKPITRDTVARFFLPFILSKTTGTDTGHGGRVISVIGARGGVGATTIAVNLAWYLGVMEKRFTVFLDADLYTGSGAMLLGGKTGPGLRMAFESPDRIDPLFIERAVQSVSGRLSILAGEEKFTDSLTYAPGAAERLITNLRLGYNFVILDVPFMPLPCNRELMAFNHHRIIVADTSLPSIHDLVNLMELPNGAWQPQGPTVVLNREGRPGTPTARQIEETAKIKFDVIIPDLPALINTSASMGELAVTKGGPFRSCIADLAVAAGFVGIHGGQGDSTGWAAFMSDFRQKLFRAAGRFSTGTVK